MCFSYSQNVYYKFSPEKWERLAVCLKVSHAVDKIDKDKHGCDGINVITLAFLHVHWKTRMIPDSMQLKPQ